MNNDLRKSASHRATVIASNVDSKAFQYVLEVLSLAWFKRYSRSDAQKEVASRHHITNETVMDAFSERRGGVTQSNFDSFLELPDLKGLEQALLKRFRDDPHASSAIREMMHEMNSCARAIPIPANLRKHLDPVVLQKIEELLGN